ncbi:hypothetical protein [Frankia sp. CcWB3]
MPGVLAAVGRRSGRVSSAAGPVIAVVEAVRGDSGRRVPAAGSDPDGCTGPDGRTGTTTPGCTRGPAPPAVLGRGAAGRRSRLTGIVPPVEGTVVASHAAATRPLA